MIRADCEASEQCHKPSRAIVFVVRECLRDSHSPHDDKGKLVNDTSAGRLAAFLGVPGRFDINRRGRDQSLRSN